MVGAVPWLSLETSELSGATWAQCSPRELCLPSSERGWRSTLGADPPPLQWKESSKEQLLLAAVLSTWSRALMGQPRMEIP